MIRTSITVALLVGAAAVAESSGFDAANRLLREQSYSKACDAFATVVSANASSEFVREATAKKAYACSRVGKPTFGDLQKLATTGEKDFARAWAMGVLVEQGAVPFESARPLLEQAAGGTGRQAEEARRLVVRGALFELQRSSPTPARVDALAKLVLDGSSNASEKGLARYLRGQRRLAQASTANEGARELIELGSGDSDWADDALFLLGTTKEAEQKFSAALEYYDTVTQRFSSVTSNVLSSAASRAASIRRKSVSLGISYFELSGQKPQVQLDWRNVKSASWTLKRVDPLAFQGSEPPDDFSDLWSIGKVVTTWTTKLEVTAPYAPGTRQFELDVKTTGYYLLEVNADGEVASGRALVTQTATLTKTDRNQLLVWVADAETGAARPGADVALWTRREDTRAWHRVDGKTDAQGLAHFKSEKSDDSLMVWTRSGNDWSMSRAGNWYGASYGRQELAYVLTDRPLFKLGESVGLKVFLRSRENGPTMPLAGRSVRLLISDPTGKKVAEPTLTTNAFGTASVLVPIAKSATLGAWHASVQADGTHYLQSGATFRVEEYKPPEYSVSVEPLGAPKPGEKVSFKVAAAYYSGGPVANAQGRALVRVTSWSHRWAPWPEELAASEDGAGEGPTGEDGEDRDDSTHWRRRRYDPYSGPVAQYTLAFKTGADGSATVEVPAAPGLSVQSLEYAVQVYVTDASRREIEGSGSVKVTATPYFVDLRSGHYLYKPGERVSLQLRAEDANGRAAEPEVLVRLVRINDEGKEVRIAETKTKLAKGRGAVVLDADALGMVRAEVVDVGPAAGQLSVLAQTDLWLTSETKPMAPRSAGFQVYTDRAPLRVGQVLRALVVSQRAGGHVLLALENESIVAARSLELVGRARYVEFPLSAELAPNGWLTASRFEEGQFITQQRPVRVRGSGTDLSVKVDLGHPVVEPGSTLAASVTTQGAPPQSAVEVALTVVDQALFAIEKERQDFLSFFGRHPRQLTVRTATTMHERGFRPRPPPARANKEPLADDKAAHQRRLGSAEAMFSSGVQSQELEGLRSIAPLASGAPPGASPEKSKRGAMEDSSGARAAREPGEAEPPVKVRADFGTSAGWFPSLAATSGAPVKQPVTLTDSLTSWKAIATVVTVGPHLGRGAATVRTAKPLMVRLQAPRFFIENDEVTLSAVVESHLPKTADIEVSIGAPGLKALGPASRVLRLEPDQIERFDARFKVSDLGDRTVRATVKGGGSSDAMEWTLPALVHGSAQRQFFAGRLGDAFKVEFELPEKRKPTLTHFSLTLSPSVLAVMLDGLPFLAQYPYGCVEQTLSRFVPATIARRTVKALHLPASRVPADLDDMIAKGLERLASFQHGDGGWGWWQTDATNRWMTAYVVYALALAREAGVAVESTRLERGRAYLVKHLGAALNDPETHAFMVFALSQSGTVPQAAVDKVYERRVGYSPHGRALVALALLAAKDPRARVAVENLDDIVKAAQTRADASVGEAHDAWSTSAAIEATALTLMAMVRYDLKSPLIGPLTDFLVLRRNGGKWRTTRDTAFATYALSELASREGAAAKRGTFVVFVNGREAKRVAFTNGGLDLMSPLVLADDAFRPGRNTVEVKRDASGTGYYAATVDVFNQNDFIRGVGGDVKVKRTYTLLGKPSTEKIAAATEYGMPVESGMRVRVDVDVTANKAIEFVMVEDLKPAGFETVLQRSGPEVCSYACAHAELRTDRVAMFLSQIPVGTTRVSYELRAEVPGKFAALPARVEAMYAPELQATADEMRFEVRDEPTTGIARP